LIWIPNSEENARGSSIVSHIESVINENCGDALQLDESQAADLAAAVASFMEINHNSGSFVDSGYLVMLASRALSSIGEQQAAHRLLGFGSGLVSPSEWEVTGGRDVWTLDLHQMTVRESETLEIVFFNSLNIVLASIADVWSESDGNGVLGLRHVCDTASALLGGGNRRSVAALSEEIKQACAAKLEQIRAERMWSHVPSIMNLDIGA
jgi:hypothetical protein